MVPESEYLLEINPLNRQLGPKKTLKFKTTKLRSVRNYKSKFDYNENFYVSIDNYTSPNISSFFEIYDNENLIFENELQKNTEFSFKNMLYNKNKTYNIILYNKSLKSNSYSDTIYHDIKISNLYLEESDSLHSIPQTSINRIINKKDTLVIKFPKASKSIQKMIKDKIQKG